LALISFLQILDSFVTEFLDSFYFSFTAILYCFDCSFQGYLYGRLHFKALLCFLKLFQYLEKSSVRQQASTIIFVYMQPF